MLVTSSCTSVSVVQWRWKGLSFTIKLACLFLCFANVSNVYCSEENGENKSDNIILNYGETLMLQCGETSSSVKWTKDGKPVETSSRIVINKNTLSLNQAKGEDVAHYSCSFQNPENDETIQNSFNVIGKPLIKVIPEDITVVEGDTLKLECIVKGNPEPNIVWKVGGEDYMEDRDRVTLSNSTEKEIIRYILELKLVETTDRGEIFCIASNDATKTEASAFIRVRDQYAALWPFLGILIEIIILCAVIFFCNKKGKGTDSDDSDTDENNKQNHTQNPRNDSVRQRK